MNIDIHQTRKVSTGTVCVCVTADIVWLVKIPSRLVSCSACHFISLVQRTE